jgi:hypothetical protein
MTDSPAQPSNGSPQARYVYGRLVENVGSRLERLSREKVVKAKRNGRDAKAKKGKQEAKSLAKMAETKILQDLSSSRETHARSATFACGGSVSFKGAAAEGTGERIEDPTEQQPNTTNTPKANTAVVYDVQVRFGDSGSGVAVNFNKDGPSPADFEHLLKACQPASFGRAGEAVLDEKYRKAGKLDRSQFATTFCPYEAGIVDVVTQLLVPQYKHGKHSRSIKVSSTEAAPSTTGTCMLTIETKG